MAGRRCTVCYHPKQAEIDEKLAQGETTRSVAAEYGLNKSAVGRHKVVCTGLVTIPRSVARTLEAAEFAVEAVGTPRKSGPKPTLTYQEGTTNVIQADLPSRHELASRLDAVTSRFEAIVEKCQREGATALSISALDKIRLTIESLSRVAGHGSGADRSVHVNVGVQVNAQDIGASLAQHLSGLTVEPSKLIEVVANEP